LLIDACFRGAWEGSWSVVRFIRSQVVIVSAIVATAFVPGCSSGGKDGLVLAPVEGYVELDGEPLSNARVEFNPVEVPEKTKVRGASVSGSVAVTDEDGRYRLQFDSRKFGAVVGEHTVKITTADVDPGSDLPQKEKVPRHYNVTTQLKETVDPGDNEIDFELTSRPISRQ
jgi:hypothetical protein